MASSSTLYIPSIITNQNETVKRKGKRGGGGVVELHTDGHIFALKKCKKVGEESFLLFD